MHKKRCGIAIAALMFAAGVALAGSEIPGLWNPGGLFGRWTPEDEVVSLRAENSKTFDNHDGTRCVIIRGPFHYKDALGRWVDFAETDDQVQVGAGPGGWPWDCMWKIGERFAVANYYRCQHIYTDAELAGFFGTITDIAFYSECLNPNQIDELLNSEHWLNDVAYTEFSGNDWEESGTSVWAGDLVIDSGENPDWVSLNLQVPFYHASGNNLLVSFYHQDGSAEAFGEWYSMNMDGIYNGKWGASPDQNPPDMSEGMGSGRADILITYTLTGQSEDKGAQALGPGLTVAPNPATTGFALLRYTLPKAGPAQVSIFDVAGRAVGTWKSLPQGRTGSLSLDLRKMSAGVYLVRLDAHSYAAIQKLVVQH